MTKQTTPAIDFTDVNIQVRRLGDLKPYGKNPRINDNAVGAVGNSIESFRYKNLIVVDKDNTIIAGHTRYKAIKKMGYKADTPIKVIVADDLTEEEGKAYRIADNSTGELATWDYDLLMPEIADLDFDMSMFGLDLTDTEAVGEPLEVVEDDYVEPEHLEPVVKRGEVYRLGGHFLMCGDSSIPEDLRKLMAQGGGTMRSNMTFTDPPYGVAIGSKNKMLNEVCGDKGGRVTEDIENDNIDIDTLHTILVAAFTNLRENSEDDASYYVTSPQGGELGMMMMMMMKEAGLPVRHLLIWAKNVATFSMRRLDYDYQHEPIMYTWGKSHKFYGKGEIKTTIWPFDKPHKCDLHPTMKPVALVAEAIMNSSKKGDIVTDIFGGSGTTMIACEQLDRRCYMMELDPHYCDVIIDRWETYTGRKAEKVVS